MLQLLGIDKSYGSKAVLRNVSLELEQGETLCLLGPSGCGKTTLLRIVAGLETPDAGELLFQGRDLLRVPVHERNFGLMFQEYALFPHMNVAQNVSFGLRMRRHDRPAARLAEILSLVGLEDMAERDVHSLSGGERQRVALARSLAPGPALLMLDEPLASLDAGLRERLLPELRRIFRDLQQSVITVTHDQQEANAIADRIAVMNAGRIEQLDAPRTLYARPRTAFVASFLGLGNLVSGDWLEQQSGIHRVEALLLLHPAGIRLADNAASHGISLTGRLEECIYEGERWRLAVRVAGQRIGFRLPLGGGSLPESGARVRLCVDPRWVLPMSEGQGSAPV